MSEQSFEDEDFDLDLLDDELALDEYKEAKKETVKQMNEVMDKRLE